MRKIVQYCVLFVCALFLLGGCVGEKDYPEQLLLVSNSYFECVAREFLSPDELAICRLSEPGTCPGHFDIRPSQAAMIRQSSLVLMFDFQSGVATKLRQIGGKEKRIILLSEHGGLCVPETYLATCAEIGEKLVEQGWLTHEKYETRLELVRDRMQVLGAEILPLTEKFRGKSVVCSKNQKEFCVWLGLSVTETFSGKDTPSLSQVLKLVDCGKKAEIVAVIGNIPEGNLVAKHLADEIEVPVCMLANFPDPRVGFDDMIQKNVQLILKQFP